MSKHFDHFQGFSCRQGEGNSYQELLGANTYGSHAPEEYGSSIASLLEDQFPFSAGFPSFYENSMGDSVNTANKGSQPCGMPNSWPISVNPKPYDIYHTGDLDTLGQNMLEPTSVILNDDGFTESSTFDPHSQLNPQPHIAEIINFGQAQAVMDSQPPFNPKGEGFVSSLTENTPKSKLIEGELVLRLLFKYISKPTIEDMENIAEDTGYSFQYVIDSYCHYRNAGRTNGLTANEPATVGRLMSSFMRPDILQTGGAPDSAYGTQIERSNINNTEPPVKRMRLDESSHPKSPELLAGISLSKPHRCPKCNQAFHRLSDMKRHLKTHAPGQFRCSYSGCNKVFSRKDKLNEHWKRMHEDSTFPVNNFKHKHDDSDKDSNSNSQRDPNNSFPRGYPPQNSQNSASSTNSTPSNPNSTFSYGYTLSPTIETSGVFSNNRPADKVRSKLAASEVIRKLGQGGFSSVYEVSICHGDGSKDCGVVASKIIQLPKDHRKEVIQRVQNEISILQLLDHSHIIKLAGAYALFDRVFINTLPVADCNLTQFLKKLSIPISVPEKTKLWEQIWCVASAVAYIHNYKRDLGYSGVHLDIKPDNILVMVDAKSKYISKLVLSDFGSATIAPSTSQISQRNRAVTPKYCAPEFAKGQIGRAVDIWSLGCVVSQVFTYLHDRTMQDFEAHGSKRMYFKRKWNYNEITPALIDWLRSLSSTHGHLARPLIQPDHTDLIIEMLRLNPYERPSVDEVVNRLRPNNNMEMEKLIADPGLAIEGDPGCNKHILAATRGVDSGVYDSKELGRLSNLKLRPKERPRLSEPGSEALISLRSSEAFGKARLQSDLVQMMRDYTAKLASDAAELDSGFRNRTWPIIKEGHPENQLESVKYPPLTRSCRDLFGFQSDCDARTAGLGKSKPTTMTIISFMGITGAGKSHFINQLAQYGASVESNWLNGNTHAAYRPIRFKTNNGLVVMVDTPGFDDNRDPDTEPSLKLFHGLALHGIIYAMRNINLSKKLCANHCRKKIVLATTEWERITASKGTADESGLREEISQASIDSGIFMGRYHADHASVLEISRGLFEHDDVPDIVGDFQMCAIEDDGMIYAPDVADSSPAWFLEFLERGKIGV